MIGSFAKAPKVARALKAMWPLVMCAAAVGCMKAADPPRDVVLVARGMSFFLENAREPNPAITLRAGERVRLVLKNEAPGLLHDVEIPGWDIAVDPVRAGEQTEVTFVVPDTPGRHEYRCRPHAEMMQGTIEVQ